MEFYERLEREGGIRLTGQQRRAVEHGSGPALLLAVPGSGKTTVLVCRALYLAERRGVAPHQVLTLCYNRAAARDLTARYRQIAGNQLGREPAFQTLHALCYQMLKRDWAENAAQALTLLEGGEKRALLRQLIRRQNPDFLPEEELLLVEQDIGYVKNALIPPKRHKPSSSFPMDFAQLCADYERYKLEGHLMDYDDMLERARQALYRNAGLLEAYRRQYPYVQLDEAQDASLLMHDILEKLVGEPANLMMVGDEDQSIYGFRGANPATLLAFESLYPGAQVLKLECNFRSTQAIVEPAARFIARSPNRYPKRMTAQREDGEPVELTRLSDWADQADAVVQRALFLGLDDTLGVLYRVSDSSLPLADALERAGVGFRVREDGGALFENRLWRELRALLRLSLDPGDRQAMAQVYHRVFPYATAAMREAYLAAEDTGDALCDFVRANGMEVSHAEQLATRRRQLRAVAGLKAADALKELALLCGFNVSAGSTPLKLGALMGVARRAGKIPAFLARMEALRELYAQSAKRDEPVTLTTVHSAKGLEFTEVLVVDALMGVFPSHQSVAQRRAGRPEDFEEEARLFYVAVTRARERLTLYASGKLFGTGARPSPFIEQLLEPKTPEQSERSERSERPAVSAPDRPPSPAPVRGTMGYTPQLEFSRRPTAAPKAEPVRLSEWVGRRVHHRRFGEGVVYRVNEGAKTGEIQFPGIGRKKLMLLSCIQDGTVTRIDP